MEWLAHSQKKHCELCKTPFQFTNFYDPAMPKRLPLQQFLTKMMLDIRSGILLCLRWTLVAFVWLVWLPYCTRHIWRSTIRINDHMTSNGLTHLHELATMTGNGSSLMDAEAMASSSSPSNQTDLSLHSFLPFSLEQFTPSEGVNRIMIDIFEGQVITSIVVAVFVIVFLIREWIVQNNANLLDETPEFLERGNAAVNEAGVRHLRAAAGFNREENRPQVEATDRVVVDNAIDYLEAQLEYRNVGVNRAPVDEDMTEPRTLIPRQPPAESSDWDNLTAQALHNARRNNDLASPQHSVPYDSRTVADLESEITQAVRATEFLGSERRPDVMDTEDNSTMTAAELRATRRQAILRATTQRLAQAQTQSDTTESLAGSVDSFSSAFNSISDTDSASLDARLARVEGWSTAGHARVQFARQRSTERRLWEEAEELGGEYYPDSPMPAPRSAPEVAEELSLPSPVVNDSARWRPSSSFVEDSHFRREVEIAATSHNPRMPDARTDMLPSPMLELPPDDGIVPSLTNAQLQTLLNQVRDAPTATERTHIANAAIQVCVDMAQLLRPNQPLDRASPLYRETLRQVGIIATVANEYGIERTLDIERAFQIAESRPIIRNAQNLRDVAAINEAAELNQEDLRGLQAAIVEGNVEANAARDEIDDDIDGLLQLIGVRGPVVTLLQNSMLIVIMMTSFIVVGICLPDICGRVIISIAEDPRTYLIQLPFQVIIVMLHEANRILRLTIRGAGILSAPILTHSRAVRYFILGIRQGLEFGQKTCKFPARAIDLHPYWETLVHAAQQTIVVFTAIVTRGGLAQTFANLGSAIPQRLLTVACGYLGLTTASVVYLRANRRLTAGEQGKQIELAFRSFLRQTGFVMKFVAILSIELVLFPFYCGLLLDAVFLPLFKEASLMDRLTFLAQYPFTSVFLHWLIGTVYMFNFAMFVSMCRDIVRPGVLYFIRDPNDPGFNPIKDIIERPVRNQMRKIGISVLIYGTLIIGALGTVVWSVSYYMPGVLPLNWSTAEPLFEVPFDLLLFQILLPLTFRYINPQKKIKGVWTQWFITTSELLRLTSFLLGSRDQRQEGHINGRNSIISQMWFNTPNIGEHGFSKDGSFRRVPNTDSLPMRKGKDMIMVVTEDNELIGNTEDDDTRDDPNYSVVYAPPNFKLRIYIFMTLLWAFAALFCISCTVVPLVVGRKIFRVVSPEAQMHDLFAYLYGAYALGFAVCALLFLSEAHISASWFKSFTTKIGDTNETRRLMHATTRFALKWLYLISTLSILTPTLLGLCLETYVIIPLGIWLHPGYTPIVHLIHDWIVGLICVKIIGKAAMMMPMSALGQALNNTMHNDWRNGWKNPDLRIATKKIILPVAGVLVAALMLPLSIGALARGTVYRGAPKEVTTLIYRMSYPAALISCVVILVLKGTQVLITRWRTRIRDALYLKGRRLHNFGESQPPPSPSNLQPNRTEADTDIVADASDAGASADAIAASVLEEIVQEIEDHERQDARNELQNFGAYAATDTALAPSRQASTL